MDEMKRVGDEGVEDARKIVNYLNIGPGWIGKQIKLN